MYIDTLLEVEILPPIYMFSELIHLLGVQLYGEEHEILVRCGLCFVSDSGITWAKHSCAT